MSSYKIYKIHSSICVISICDTTAFFFTKYLCTCVLYLQDSYVPIISCATKRLAVLKLFNGLV